MMMINRGAAVLRRLIVAFVAGLVVACGHPPEPLHAAVRFTGATFVLSNLDRTEWTDVVVDLNPPGRFSRGYQVHLARLGPGETREIGAMQFARADGTRFNPVQTRPTGVEVRATMGGQSLVHVGQFE
jgi:hypothetical protein